MISDVVGCNMDIRSLRLLMSTLKKNKKSSEQQKTLNDLLDAIIFETARHNNGVFPLPDVRENFTEESSWKPCGKFHARDGQFSDLTTLKRINDVHLSRKGCKFTGSCSLRLSKASAHYKHYSLRYGIEVAGKLTASIDGVDIIIKITVDLGKKRHRMTLQELKITRLGKIKIRITGLGPLNLLTSKLISWITLRWQETIVDSIEESLRESIREFFSQINF